MGSGHDHEREHQPCSTRGFLLHERDGRLAGFCWTKVHEPENDLMNEVLMHHLGEIYVSRSTRTSRATVLVASSCSQVWPRSPSAVSTGMLYVDHDNEAVAISTFSRVHRRHTDRAYVTDVPAGGAGEAPVQAAGSDTGMVMSWPR